MVRKLCEEGNTYACNTQYNFLELASIDFSILILMGPKASDEHSEERELDMLKKGCCAVKSLRTNDQHATEACHDRDKRGPHI